MEQFFSFNLFFIGLKFNENDNSFRNGNFEGNYLRLLKMRKGLEVKFSIYELDRIDFIIFNNFKFVHYTNSNFQY